MTSDILMDFYSRPQLGGTMAVFKGARRQIGGSFLSSLARFAIPILKFLGKKAVGVATNVATDVIDRQMSLRESVPKRTRESIMETLHGVQAGRGQKHAKRRKLVAHVQPLDISEINTPAMPPNAVF